MGYVGIFIVMAAAWTMYAAFYGINPAKTGFAILQNPDQAGKVLQDARVAAQTELQTALAANRVTGVSETVQAAANAATGDGGTVVAFARAQIGKPYRLGGAGPNVWDCSGLVQVAFAKVGVKVSHSALAQSLRGVKITRKADLVAGDLLFPTGLGVAAIGDHVQIYSGSGTVIEAANPQAGVREVPLSHWWKSDTVIARRYLSTATSTDQNKGRDYAAPTPKPGANAKPNTGTSSNTAGNYYGAGNGR